MKNLFIFTFLIFLGISNYSYSQDLILLKNGEEIKAVVNEVALDIIKYKKFDNPDGPVYTIEKRMVVMITYKNGSKDIFSELPKTEAQKQEKVPQKPVESILTSRNGVVKKNGKNLPVYEVRLLMENNYEALKLYNSGQKLISVGGVFGYAGIGIVLIAAVVENKGSLPENNAAMVGVIGGVACLGTSMALTFSGRSKVKRSVGIYNSGLKQQAFYQVGLGVNQNGLALIFKF